MTYAQKLKTRIFAEGFSSSPVRAVIYARVSTDNESQKESCANQIFLAERFLSQHPNIQLVDTFTDDGLSGKNDYNRPAYGRMLELVSLGKVDLIITKALSRLNRDQFNALSLANLLIAHCATVYTLEDSQLHDFEDLNSSLLHGLNYAIDAQYVLRQSISGRKVHELRCERKELSAKDISYGYKWDRLQKFIYIDKKEAESVVFIFNQYVFHGETPASIYRQLKERGVMIGPKTVSNILKDERYIGHFFINKRTSKLGTGNNKTKRINLPKDQWVLVDRPDLRIIDDELFKCAQSIMDLKKSIYVKNDAIGAQAYYTGKHKYAGKIYCACCGKSYQFRPYTKGDRKSKYRLLNHWDCDNKASSISEEDMESITRKALKDSLDAQSGICEKLEQLLTECIEELKGETKTTDRLISQKKKKEQQIDTLINELSEGGLSDAARNRIKTRLNEIELDIEELSKTISAATAVKYDSSYVTDQIRNIKEAFKDLHNFSELDRDRISNYIDRIFIQKNGDVDLILRSGRTVNFKAEQFLHGPKLRGPQKKNTSLDENTEGDPNEDPHYNKVKMRIQGDRYLSIAPCQWPPGP